MSQLCVQCRELRGDRRYRRANPECSRVGSRPLGMYVKVHTSGMTTPQHDPELVKSVVSWCRRSSVDPLTQEMIPGATLKQRQPLAALGGLVAALAETYGRTTGSLDRWPDAVTSWAKAAPRPPTDMISGIRSALGNEGSGLFAAIYERIVAGPNRRHLGTFFTPAAVLEFMVTRAKSVSQNPTVIVDPGAGVGAFTESALREWPHASVHAIDVNVVTLGLLAARCSAMQTSQEPIFHHADYLGWIQAVNPHDEAQRLFIGNPPYTRHHLMNQATKKLAQAASGELCPSGQAGLSTHFLAATLRRMQARDTLCFLLPTNWLETNYGRHIREHLWQLHSRLIEIHMFPHGASVFPNAQVSAMVILIGPETQRKQEMRYFQVAQNQRGRYVAKSVTKRKRAGSAPPIFTRESLSQKVKGQIGEKCASAKPLSDVATVRRGVATGDNSFFIRTDAEVAHLPEAAYVRALPSLRNISFDDLTTELHETMGRQGARRWLLRLDKTDSTDPAVAALMHEGEKKGTPERYLCKIRTPWYAVEEVPIPDILIAPMSKSEFKVVSNTAQAIPTNSLYGIRLLDRAAAELFARPLTLWLQSEDGQKSLRALARRHSDGIFKLEPRALSGLQIPNHVFELGA
ncbi:N-6 DNA methylase [Streptomyces parvus]|uniref:site-specific DNA-methyltransferase (adenine-specific) n=2 Tax=Streptomyces parvus TaxID=66428 RepID=A0A5D4JA43_9ACTN|nr:N-6 DNA methylase [Streptomyces parvus]